MGVNPEGSGRNGAALTNMQQSVMISGNKMDGYSPAVFCERRMMRSIVFSIALLEILWLLMFLLSTMGMQFCW